MPSSTTDADGKSGVEPDPGAELVAATVRDVTPATLRRVEAEVRDRGPFGFDLRKASWPYWLHALTRRGGGDEQLPTHSAASPEFMSALGVLNGVLAALLIF